jgi:hypothetical protein
VKLAPGAQQEDSLEVGASAFAMALALHAFDEMPKIMFGG